MATAPVVVRKTALTTWEHIWYVLQCIAFGAGYFAKVPAKRALSDFGLCEPTGAERFWYVLQCCAFGAGYFAKIPTAKALTELSQSGFVREALPQQAHVADGLAGKPPMPTPPQRP
jgi:hypothetical protein